MYVKKKDREEICRLREDGHFCIEIIKHIKDNIFIIAINPKHRMNSFGEKLAEYFPDLYYKVRLIESAGRIFKNCYNQYFYVALSKKAIEKKVYYIPARGYMINPKPLKGIEKLEFGIERL